MTKQERIKKDRQTFKNMGFKNVKFKYLYDYFNDINISTTIYVVSKGKQRILQMLFPNELNPKDIYNLIVEQLNLQNIIENKFEFTEKGMIYNILTNKENVKTVYTVKYDPITKDITYKELEFDG